MVHVRETLKPLPYEPGGFRSEVWFPVSHFAELGAKG